MKKADRPALTFVTAQTRGINCTPFLAPLSITAEGSDDRTLSFPKVLSGTNLALAQSCLVRSPN
jgi:hypothetical protein